MSLRDNPIHGRPPPSIEKENSLSNSALCPPKPPKILVVEDNADQWFITRWALLRRFPQAQIYWLANDQEVLPYLDACQPAVEELPHMILVDLYLPRPEQGLTLLQSLKSHLIYQPIPTLALSWSTSREDIDQVFHHSADGYLIKPTRYDDWIIGLGVLDNYLP